MLFRSDGLDYYLNTGDPAVALPALRAGQLDFGAAISTKADADALLKSNPDIRVNVSPIVFSSGGMSFNLTNPKFKDERVRRAISMAVDRPAFIQKAFGGYGRSVAELGWPFVFDHIPSDAELGQYFVKNVPEAQKLLQAAGQQDRKSTRLNSSH